MKLFVIATLIAAAAAARLDHLEKGYLPPESQSSAPLSSGGQSFSGSTSGSYGSSGLSSPNGGELGSQQSSATLNQYLPPDRGPSGGIAPIQTFRPLSQGSLSAQYQSQTGSPSNQYLGPQASPSPGSFSSTQQPFDEETGYHYKK